MARVQLIICDKCKKNSEELLPLEVTLDETLRTFEICNECAREITDACLEPPEVLLDKKKKTVYRKSEHEVDSSRGTVVTKPCKHESQEYEDPGKLICTTCGNVSKA